MIKVSKALISITILATLGGCGLGGKNYTGTAGRTTVVDQGKYLFFNPGRTYIRGLPQGNDSYSRGFRSGCQTHMSIVGSGTLRLLPEVIDANQLVNDPQYLRGFNDGGGYCWARLDWDGH